MSLFLGDKNPGNHATLTRSGTSMKFSIVIPAHNEEKYIGACFDAIEVAGARVDCDIEIIVVVNRCIDRTEEIARSRGAVIVHEDARCLAKIRNTGAKVARGEILITIDADSIMPENTLQSVSEVIDGGDVIGGGAIVVPDRWSPGLAITYFFLYAGLILARLSGGMYYCVREDFDAIGGFNEELVFGEDLEFSKRLKKYAKSRKKKYRTLWDVRILTSMRKFDRFGDWYFFKLIFYGIKSFRAKDKEKLNKIIEEYFYDFEN